LLAVPSARAFELQNSGIWDSDSVDRAFDSGPAWFSAGPAWMMNALPGSHFRARYIDRAGDTQESTAETPYVGTLHDVFDVSLFNNIATFGGVSTGKTTRPFVADGTLAIKQFDGATAPDTAIGISTSWNSTSGFSWRADGVPTSSDDVLFDNAFRTTLQNVQLGGNSDVANSLTIDLTTQQTWSLGATSGTSAATLTLTTGNITRNNEATNSSVITIGATTGTGIGTGILTLATPAAGFTFTNSDTDGTLVIQAIISGTNKTVTSVGPGTTIFGGANSYSGKTSIANGILSVSSLNSVTGGTTSSNLGHPITVANGTIDLGSTTTTGQLTYTGSGETTDRVINLAGTTGGATIDQSGASGSLTFTSALTATGAGSKTLTLQGSNAGTGEIGGAIVDNSSSNTTAVLKQGTGTWTLSGNNTYSGGTTVSDGLLYLKSSTALGSSSGSLTVNGGILDLNGQTISVGNLTGSGGTIWNNGPLSGTATVTLTIGNGDTGGGTYAGLIRDNNPSSNAGKIALTKTGTGTITLSGANDYTGVTTVSGGALFINGNQSAATGAVTVNGSGTTLGGSGTIGGSVTVSSGSTSNNNLSPGGSGVGSVAKLNTGALTLNTSTNFNIDITGAGGTGNAGITYDQLGVTGTVNLGGILASNLVLNVSGLTQTNVGEKFFIVLNDGTDLITTTFAQGTTVTSGADVFLINYADNGDGGSIGNDISLTLTAVPEPSTWIGAALALGAIGITQRKRFAKRLRVIR
jgi:autotransporter-associated beta strand protein